MATGPRDTQSLVSLPAGWDATELANFRLEDGVTFAQVVSDMNAALSAINAELANDRLWASLASFTDQPEVEYRQGTSNGMERFTEYGRADAKRADTTGHMLPLLAYDRMLGWTWNYLRKARSSQVEADIADAIMDVRTRWRVSMLTRLIKRGDDSGAANGLGTAGYSPGFATAAASTNVDFTPPTFGGTSFNSNHEHYVGISGGAFTNAVFQDAYDELREHGHEPPFDFIVGTDHRAEIEALSASYVVGDNLVRYGGNASLANVSPDDYFAVNNHFRIREVRGVPQYYGFGWKSYGPGSQRNPLRVRLAKGVTRPGVTAFPDPRSGQGAAYPLQNLMLFLEFGVGVGDRTNGTARYVNNTTWADGTPT